MVCLMSIYITYFIIKNSVFTVGWKESVRPIPVTSLLEIETNYQIQHHNFSWFFLLTNQVPDLLFWIFSSICNDLLYGDDIH